MIESGDSPGTLSFRLAGDVEKSFATLSDKGGGLRDRRSTGDGCDTMQGVVRSRTLRYESCLLVEGFLVA